MARQQRLAIASPRNPRRVRRIRSVAGGRTGSSVSTAAAADAWTQRQWRREWRRKWRVSGTAGSSRRDDPHDCRGKNTQPSIPAPPRASFSGALHEQALDGSSGGAGFDGAGREPSGGQSGGDFDGPGGAGGESDPGRRESNPRSGKSNHPVRCTDCCFWSGCSSQRPCCSGCSGWSDDSSCSVSPSCRFQRRGYCSIHLGRYGCYNRRKLWWGSRNIRCYIRYIRCSITC
ncbi:hypothetical protein CLOM_g548 [Closterium sp. NIES-68]|nr:hypothetical protein CLOM_g548 [Closterium sp. NIES-68]GJP69161.1 hypothetical protein CLOP_g118 [Closterium sp. NIES-67]